jgi:hypothetical protein
LTAAVPAVRRIRIRRKATMMAQHIGGRLHQVGIQVQEVFEFTLDLEPEQESAYQQDPASIIRQFLEQEGQTVNNVRLLLGNGSSAQSGPPPSTQMQSAFHIVYPDGERSGWISCCA